MFVEINAKALTITYSDCTGINEVPEQIGPVIDENENIHYMTRVQNNDPIAQSWLKSLGQERSILTDFPEGYLLFKHEKVFRDKEQSVANYYLFGNFRYKSINSFLPHLFWLISNKSRNCKCHFCISNKIEENIEKEIAERKNVNLKSIKNNNDYDNVNNINYDKLELFNFETKRNTTMYRCGEIVWVDIKKLNNEKLTQLVESATRPISTEITSAAQAISMKSETSATQAILMKPETSAISETSTLLETSTSATSTTSTSTTSAASTTLTTPETPGTPNTTASDTPDTMDIRYWPGIVLDRIKCSDLNYSTTSTTSGDSSDTSMEIDTPNTSFSLESSGSPNKNSEKSKDYIPSPMDLPECYVLIPNTKFSKELPIPVNNSSSLHEDEFPILDPYSPIDTYSTKRCKVIYVIELLEICERLEISSNNLFPWPLHQPGILGDDYLNYDTALNEANILSQTFTTLNAYQEDIVDYNVVIEMLKPNERRRLKEKVIYFEAVLFGNELFCNGDIIRLTPCDENPTYEDYPDPKYLYLKDICETNDGIQIIGDGLIRRKLITEKNGKPNYEWYRINLPEEEYKIDLGDVAGRYYVDFPDLERIMYCSRTKTFKERWRSQNFYNTIMNTMNVSPTV
ncbi:5248_t:CDS:2 [Diversispora eburnea]|uniref:5248_t:CDS:1 n=1 Tax=Diversispora eburnea TaxID=1213867 RepID=A0A9N8WEP3_9GLOM|nr:5248_t:CDS:2 [Diversispora eburnea]